MPKFEKTNARNTREYSPQTDTGAAAGPREPSTYECNSSWPLHALKASHALSGSKKTPIGLAANSPTLNFPANRLANHAAPCRQALGGMLLHPLGELRSAHQPGLHRDVSEVRGGDGLLVAICRGGQTAKHCDDLDHDRRTPSPRWALAPLTVRLTDPLSCCSLTGSAGGKMPSYIARASRIRRARSRSDLGTNRRTSPMFTPSIREGILS
jgi:hypothetical protein